MLQKNTDYLKRWSSTKVMVEGHADARGTNEYNLALGERRAGAARDYVVSLGIPVDRVTVVSKGEEAAGLPGRQRGLLVEEPPRALHLHGQVGRRVAVLDRDGHPVWLALHATRRASRRRSARRPARIRCGNDRPAHHQVIGPAGEGLARAHRPLLIVPAAVAPPPRIPGVTIANSGAAAPPDQGRLLRRGDDAVQPRALGEVGEPEDLIEHGSRDPGLGQRARRSCWSGP